MGAVPAEAAPAAARSRHGAAAVPLRRHPPAAGGTAQGGGREGGRTRGAEAAAQPLGSARRRHSAGGTTWGGGEPGKGGEKARSYEGWWGVRARPSPAVGQSSRSGSGQQLDRSGQEGEQPYVIPGAPQPTLGGLSLRL